MQQSFQKPSKPPPRPSGDKPCLVVALALLGGVGALGWLIVHAVTLIT